MSYATSSRPPHARQRPGQGAGLLGGLGRACYRHRWTTLFAWIVGVACLITLWTQVRRARPEQLRRQRPRSDRAQPALPPAAGDTLTLADPAQPPRSPPGRPGAGHQRPHPVRAGGARHRRSPTRTPAPGRFPATGTSRSRPCSSASRAPASPTARPLSLMNDATAASGHGVKFSLGGDVVDLAETPYGGPTDGVGVAAAAIILLIAFGSLLAMGLPIATARARHRRGPVADRAARPRVPGAVVLPDHRRLIGLGVGIDYALFIVTRFRESLRAGTAPEAAAVTAMRTAGRSVLIAGTTVVIGMLGLLVLRQALLNGVAVAAAATVAMVLLGLAHPAPRPARLHAAPGWPSRPGSSRPRWLRQHGQPVAGEADGSPAAERWAGGYPAPPGDRRHRRPPRFILVLAAPALGMKLSFPDESARRAAPWATPATRRWRGASAPDSTRR